MENALRDKEAGLPCCLGASAIHVPFGGSFVDNSKTPMPLWSLLLGLVLLSFSKWDSFNNSDSFYNVDAKMESVLSSYFCFSAAWLSYYEFP